MSDALDNARAALDATKIIPTATYADAMRALHQTRAALRGLIAEHERLTSEMHQRELHHFETEKLLTDAGINPDNVADARTTVERLTAPPTDLLSVAVANTQDATDDYTPPTYDEREALVKLELASYPNIMSDGYPSLCLRTNQQAADIVLAAGFRRQGPVTDAEVEAGCAGFYNDPHGLTQWNRLAQADPALADKYRAGMRAALEAARGAR